MVRFTLSESFASTSIVFLLYRNRLAKNGLRLQNNVFTGEKNEEDLFLDQKPYLLKELHNIEKKL